MSEQEAVERLKAMGDACGYVEACADYECEKCHEARDICIQTLEKQIPKKPIHVSYRIKSTGRKKHNVYCGFCGKFSSRVYMGDNYCRKCGTKIDWSDEQ